MGLDTSHDCWHGPYSAFHRWRVALHRDAGTYQHGDIDADLRAAWERGDYADQSVPINVLMSHSDCDGEIPACACGPLADALQKIVDTKMPPRALYDVMRPATERFITGLRLAASRNEPVMFG